MYLAGCLPYQKNGQIVRQVVGYDRFVGELAYRQLTELYRALRLYVNCFQPSMKLQTKQREGSKVRRTYDQAQTPLQRLLASGELGAVKHQKLVQVTHALDPLRLLHQLEHLQKALWQHAIALSPPPERTQAASMLPFSVQLCSEEKGPAEGITASSPSLLKKERRRKYQRSGRPHDWRTREDPYEGLWEQITSWLVANPERTGIDIFGDVGPHRLVQVDFPFIDELHEGEGSPCLGHGAALVDGVGRRGFRSFQVLDIYSEVGDLSVMEHTDRSARDPVFRKEFGNASLNPRCIYPFCH
jgi:hypothetical protein